MTDPLTNEEERTDQAEATASETTEADDAAASNEGADPPSDDETEAAEGERDASAATTVVEDESPADDAEAAAGGDRTELSEVRRQFESLNDRHLRLVAEFNNFRRRSEQERLSAWARAQADLVANLLDVLDDIQRVADLDLSNATVDAIMEGIDLVERKFLRQLEEAGVEVIDPDGEPFDPERMEAMMRVPAEEDEQVDMVAQVFQKGYSLKNILVRPARVSVYTQG